MEEVKWCIDAGGRKAGSNICRPHHLFPSLPTACQGHRMATRISLPKLTVLTRHFESRATASLFTRTISSNRPIMAHPLPEGESTVGVNEWKTRPPYRIHEKNENFKALYEAHCHCERVKYQLSRKEPLDSKLCHCATVSCRTPCMQKRAVFLILCSSVSDNMLHRSSGRPSSTKTYVCCQFTVLIIFPNTLLCLWLGCNAFRNHPARHSALIAGPRVWGGLSHLNRRKDPFTFHPISSKCTKAQSSIKECGQTDSEDVIQSTGLTHLIL